MVDQNHPLGGCCLNAESGIIDVWEAAPTITFKDSEMENIREIIDDELQRVRPEKLPTAVIALSSQEYETFTNTSSYYWDEVSSAAANESKSTPVYDGHPVIRMHNLKEPFVIYTEASLGLGVTDYLARD